MNSPIEHRISDYARPALPLPMRALNALGGPLLRRFVSLDEASLLTAAQGETGLSDFGDGSFREPLRVLLDAIERSGTTSPVGRYFTRKLLTQLLATRLRMEALLTAHPEILEQPVVAPIVIMGLPRTGTSHLHSLISQDPDLRHLPYWESLEPLPSEDERLVPGFTSATPDPRIKRCASAVDFVHYAMPLFPLMHEMTPESPHEEIQLLAIDFSTMLFEASHVIPSYRDWYLATDQTPYYLRLKRTLQVLQWLRGGQRWVLKSPQHLEQIGPLLAAFPDARIIQTHRDPVSVTASFCTMGAYGLRMNCGAVDPLSIGAYWSDRIERMLNASVEHRDRIPQDQVLDVRFHEFMADPHAKLAEIYQFAGQPMSSDARSRMQAYSASHTRGRNGVVGYRLHDFGIEPDERRRALSHYQRRFDVPDE